MLDDSKNINDELIYTAITRTKRNLIVISLGNERYDDFFSSFTPKRPPATQTAQRKDESTTMRKFSDSTHDYELSNVPTPYVHSTRYGVGYVTSASENGLIRVTFTNGHSMEINYNHFHNKGELDYIRPIPKKNLLEKLFSRKKSSSSPQMPQANSKVNIEPAPSVPVIPTSTESPLSITTTPAVSTPSESATPATHSSVSETSIVAPQQPKSVVPLQLNGNHVPVMLEPVEQKKMLQYLTVHQPELMEDCPDSDSALQYVMEHVFPASIQTNCIVANYCCISEATGNPIREFAIRSCDNAYLKKRLEDPNLQLKIHGLLNPSNIFRIKDIEVVSQSECTENENYFTLRFSYPKENPRYPQKTALDQISKLIPAYALTQEDELGLWTEYIDWKQRLAEIKVFGIKYIDYLLAEAKDGSFQFHFLAVMPNNQERTRLMKLVQKEHDQIAVLASNVSKDRWNFVFNPDHKYANDFGLRFSKAKQITFDKWISGGDSRALNNCLSTIKKMTEQYPEPCYADIIFDIPAEYEDKFAAEDYSSERMYDYLKSKLVKNIPTDGFIATSRVGDFALNRRLRDALTSLRGGHAVSNNLGNWLFDIQFAREAQTHTEISSIEWSPWGKDRLNASQKTIVQKMLDAPEVFLCQGPPGTGKTTVIAEAVYQFALRKKRVLIASQTNLAVNNALSKLLGYPGIRAIRLGGQGKIDSSVEHITEENILRTFYGNVKTHIQQRYFNKWNEIDACVVEPTNDQADARETLSKKAAAFQQYATVVALLKQVNSQIEQYNEDYDQEDEESDLRYLQLAVAVLSGSKIEDRNRVSVTDCDFLLMGLSEPLAEVQKLGYALLPSNTEIAEVSELPRRKKTALVHNTLKFFTAINTYRYSPACDDRSQISDELKALEQQRDLLRSNLTDYSSFLMLKKIMNRIQILKPQIATSSQILFPEELTACLPKKYRSFVETHGMTATTMNQIAVEIGNASLSAVTYIANYMLIMQERKLQEKKIANPEFANTLYKKCADAFTEFKAIQKEISEHQQRLEMLALKYNCSVGDLEVTIERKIDTLKNQDEEAISARKHFNVFFHDLIDYIGKLDDENQYKLENDIYQAPFINACNVVGVSCTERTKTLTAKGFDKFDVVIIDEVSKATPPEMLIPLLLAEKAILVGDHRQLPPLFNEHYASYQELRQTIDYADENNDLITDENYARFEGLVTNSLFKRHYERASSENKGALLVQYRMHREIMNVVNSFYNGLLTSGWSITDEAREKKHFVNISNPRGSVSLITPAHHAYWVDSSAIHNRPVYEIQEGSSKVNQLEIALIVQLVQKIDDSYAKQGFERIDVGVISFYGKQVQHLRENISKLHLKCVRCDVNTVDRFQGKEKPIILVSLVRNVAPGKSYDASYVQAYQRMNVAFSRAQNLLIIVGAQAMYTQQDIIIENMENGEKLPPRKVYKDIIERLEMNGCRFTADEFLGPNFNDTNLQNH